MRAVIAFLAFICLFIALPAIAGSNSLAWDGPSTLTMPKLSPTIDSKLANSIVISTSDASTPVWVFFTDKKIFTQNEFYNSLNEAQSQLTQAAYQRRLKARGSENLIDFRDLPVNSDYANQVLATGAKIRQNLRWFNAITIDATPAQINQIANLRFVRFIKSVSYSKVDFNPPLNPIVPDLSLVTLSYGPSAGQLNQINVVPAHELGFKGQNIIVCMMDVGYKQGHDAFQNIINSGRLLAQWDFINHDNNTDYDPNQDVDGQADHGTLTWSTLGGEASTHLYGPSYLANFILAKTEDISSERHIEEDNWAAGAQWADSIGASVISSSLGYRDFDQGQGDYSYEDLNGHTTIVTLAAAQAARNGITVANAMGNAGNTPGSLIAPADADSILSCGAVGPNGDLTYFSSWGPTSDGRIKPEVCAQGEGTVCASPNDMHGFTTASGTSLSTPLVGGSAGILLSAHPNWTPVMVREALMMTANRAGNPASDYGWGVMDVSRALYYHPQGDIVVSHNPIIFEQSNHAININAVITGGSGIAHAYLYYRVGESGDYNEIHMSTSDGQNFTAEIPEQSGGSIYYYFKAIDSNTAFAFMPVGGDTHPFMFTLDSPTFTETFENGPSYWVSGGTNNSWGLSAKYGHTGNLSITDSPTGNYAPNTNSYLASNFDIDFSYISSANLTFYYRGILQTGRDTLHVDVSADGGTTWNHLPQSISGSFTSWNTYSADLANFAGHPNVRIRFHLVTDGSTEREGIYIDDISISRSVTGIVDNSSELPRSLALNQNYPNPFNPSTKISFNLPQNSMTTLTVYDLIGRKVKSLVAGDMESGAHDIIWDGTNDAGRDVASGIYLYKLGANGVSLARRMTLLK